MLIKNKMQENDSCSKPIARVLFINRWYLENTIIVTSTNKGMRRHKEEISYECQAQPEALTTLSQWIKTEHKLLQNDLSNIKHAGETVLAQWYAGL